MKKTEAGEYQISKAKSYKAVLHPYTEAQFWSHTSSYLRFRLERLHHKKLLTFNYHVHLHYKILPPLWIFLKHKNLKK